jgi:hypothetical protein
MVDKPKRWYNPEADTAVRLVTRSAEDESLCALKWRHPRVRPGLGECLIYPLKDGPGLGLLAFFPPVLWVLSLPIFDVIAVLQPLTKSDWALGLLVVPIMIPMIFSFAMTFGFALLFLGHVLVASSLGENDHPRWPEWHPADIAEGICRWLWAFLLGGVMGGVPIAFYWWRTQRLDPVGWALLAALVLFGAGYALMALAASLLHDSLIAANPFTVLAAIFRLGWAYFPPCVVAAVALLLAGLGIWGLLYKMPSMWLEALALWSFWVLVFYETMVVLRMMGLTYHAHALDLHWFRRRPRWATSTRHGQIYANS